MLEKGDGLSAILQAGEWRSSVLAAYLKVADLEARAMNHAVIGNGTTDEPLLQKGAGQALSTDSQSVAHVVSCSAVPVSATQPLEPAGGLAIGRAAVTPRSRTTPTRPVCTFSRHSPLTLGGHF